MRQQQPLKVLKAHCDDTSLTIFFMYFFMELEFARFCIQSIVVVQTMRNVVVPNLKLLKKVLTFYTWKSQYGAKGTFKGKHVIAYYGFQWTNPWSLKGALWKVKSFFIGLDCFSSIEDFWSVSILRHLSKEMNHGRDKEVVDALSKSMLQCQVFE